MEKTQRCDSYILKLAHNEQLVATGNPGNKICEDSSNICKELRGCKFNEVLTLKRRQQLRANSEELRQLERHLQSAVASQQLRQQIQNIAALKAEEVRKEREENEKFAVECELIRKSIVQQEEKEKQEKKVLLGMLKYQISDLQQKRRIEFENFKKDQNKMDKLLKQIHAEENAERKEAERLRERCKKEMEESYRNVKLKQQLEKEKEDDDTERNLAYQEECDNIKFQLAKERKRFQKEKEKLSEGIGQQLAALNQEKEKREHLLLSLLVEERKSKDDQSYRESLAKHIKERNKVRIEMENYRNDIQIQKDKQFKKDENEFREKLLRYLEECDKIYQLSNEMRHRKKMEHYKILREMIETRRCQKANKIAARIADFEKIIKNEKKSDQLIEEERIRMLCAVPKELLSYLPPGVLRSSDKQFLTLPTKQI